MKKTITGVAAVALITVAGVSSAHAGLGSLTGTLAPSFSKHSSTNQKSGRDSVSMGKNSAGRDKFDDSVKMGKNSTGRDRFDVKGNFAEDSNNRTTVTNRTDNRDYSNRSTNIDARDQSDNRVDNTRHQSHNYGDGSIVINGEGYKPRVGHENASVGTVSGSSNYIDNSVSGNFGIGHTTVQP